MADLTIGEQIRERHAEILRIAARHGATRVRIIGSVARGEARPDSDVGLLVTWAEGTSLLDHAALVLDLESLLGRKVDIASDGWVKPSIREPVYRDAIPPVRTDADRLSNILVHEYFGLNLHQVWTMAHKDLPELEKQIERIRADVASDPRRSG